MFLSGPCGARVVKADLKYWEGWTYTGSRIIRKQAMNIIKCTHHHFLKWAARRAPKPFLVGAGITLDSTSTTSGFEVDILVL